MSTPFAIDPALASAPPDATRTDAVPPTTASPANLTKPKTSPPKPSPGYYSILPAYPPLPGWGPFPGPTMFGPGALPMPVYMAPPPSPWPDLTPAASTPDPSKPAEPKPSPKRRTDPPPLNPAAAASPHYQNPGGFGGVYTPPAHLSAPSSSSSPAPAPSHYTHKPSEGPISDLGRPFACGQPSCTAAFDRKSDCERHRRTHVKAAAEARPFRCTRLGCEAAFDRKDALMRHERNERTHLVRQTQPGRVKRPMRALSKDVGADEVPRRQSTRKRKSLLPSTSDMFASDSDDDECVKRTRMEDMVVLPDEELAIDPALHGEEYEHGQEMDGGVGVEAMQAVEAIQAALQQIEADADAVKGREGEL